LTESATQLPSSHVKIYHEFGNIPIGRRSDTKQFFFFWGTSGGFLFVSRANTFRNFESRSPYVEKRSAARATRYGDIPLCMGKQSKTCESFELVQPAMAISRFVWANSLKRAKVLSPCNPLRRYPVLYGQTV